MSLIKKLAGETALYGLSSILGRILTFVVLTPFLTYVFNNQRAQIGIQTDLYAWAAFLMILFTYRMETAFFRFGAKKEDRQKAFQTAFIALLVSTLIICFILIQLKEKIALYLDYGDQPQYILWFALILGFDTLCALPMGYLRLEGKAFRFVVIKLTNLLIHLGFTMFFLFVLPNYFHEFFNPAVGISYVFIANLIASFVTLLLLLPTIRQALKGISFTNLFKTFDAILWKKMFLYALPLVVAGFAGVINELLDRILLKIYLPGSTENVLEQLGVYGACYKLTILMHLFTQAFNYAAEPFFFKNAHKDYAKKIYADVAFLFTLVACVGYLLIVLNLNFLQFFIAPNFREGLVIVPILLMANLFLGLYYNLAVWFKVTNQTQFGAMIASLGALVTLIANILLIPYFIEHGEAGYLGSAWATLLCYFTMLTAAYYIGKRYYPIPYRISSMVFYLFLTTFIVMINQFYIQPQSDGFWMQNGSNFLLLMFFFLTVYIKDGKKIRTMIIRKEE